jgi:YbbR domain-containing protein
MRRLLFENLGLKIAAVLLSIVLWIFVTSRGQSELSVDVPLEFNDIPRSLEIVNHTVKTITLVIKGQERFLKNIRPSDIRVSLDLGKAKKGDGTYSISRDDIKLPHAVTVTNITPSSVRVTLEETATKTVRVVAVLAGVPEKGYYVKSVDVMPPDAEIEGVKSEVARIKTVKTEPIDVTGSNETFTQGTKLDLTGKNIRSKTSDITVKVIIGARGK